MKKTLLAVTTIVALVGCTGEGQEKKEAAQASLPVIEVGAYPQTQKADSVVDDYFGTRIADPYRWLEDDNAEATKAWVKAQNEVTQAYISKIPYRDKIRQRLEELWNYPRYSAPFRKEENYFFYKNDGLQNQSVLYIQKGLDGEPKVILDPNTFSTDGTVSLSTVSPNKAGDKLGYGISRGGSDWSEFYVLDVNSGKRTVDSIRWVKFSGISWKNDGFFYSRFDEPKKGTELSGKNINHKVYYHKLGTPQSQDVLVWRDAKRPEMSWYAGTTSDQSYLILMGAEGAATGNELYVKKLDGGQINGSGIKQLVSGTKFNFAVADNIGDKLLVMTDKDAPRYRLVLIDPNNPEETNWQTILPESKHVLQSVSVAGGKIFATYMQDAAHHVYQYDLSGKQEREIALPGPGSVGGFDGEKEDKEVFYTFTSFTAPATVYRYNIASGKSEVFRESEMKFDPSQYESKQVFYPSKDGTKIPMFIVHKKGLKLDGNNPTHLYGYGGFNISLNPGFSVSRLVFLENGGVFAMPNLRGGGEYGEDWHQAGMKEKKQNVFDDFIAAAEYLIKEGYTSKEKLAIQGGSNGGLLVGACMAQRPDLFAVALPAVGVMDMLRYHKFTIGRAWEPEYGSSDDSTAFNYLIRYSPLHNLKEGTEYPATLVTTADHDDRVVPAHSFKFISELQEKQGGNNPVLIRVETDAGHGAGKPTSKIIDEYADIWAFTFYNLGMTME